MRIAAMAAAMLFVSVIALTSMADVPAAEPLPTADELQQLYKNGDYGPLLQKLNRVLQLKGDAARPYDRIKLYLLKGDTHLQMKENSLAMAAYASAVKAIDAQTDPRQAAIARSTEQLLKRSRAFTYTPRQPANAAPISVTDVTLRDKCFAAMFDEAKSAIVVKMRAAKAAKTLPPIVDAVNAVTEMRTYELAAFGKDDQSAAEVDTLAGQAKDLMSRATKDLKSQVDRASRTANELLPIRLDPSQAQTQTQLYYKKGVDPKLAKELKAIEDDGAKIAQAANAFSDISKKYADAFGEVKAAAEKTADAAKEVRTGDYAGQFTK